MTTPLCVKAPSLLPSSEEAPRLTFGVYTQPPEAQARVEPPIFRTLQMELLDSGHDSILTAGKDTQYPYLILDFARMHPGYSPDDDRFIVFHLTAGDKMEQAHIHTDLRAALHDFANQLI